MKSILILNKREGETPLAALLRLRAKSKKYENIKMTYAGRLDPMASGVLLALLGEEIKNKEKYLALDKEYEFEVLFGFATDTHDILGKVTSSKVLTNIRTNDIRDNLKFFRGKFRQAYPMYSSPNIGRVMRGKHVVARTHVVEVKQLQFLGLRKISGKTLWWDVGRRIGKIAGDFRQAEILAVWQRHLKGKEPKKFFVGKFHVKCGSGM